MALSYKLSAYIVFNYCKLLLHSYKCLIEVPPFIQPKLHVQDKIIEKYLPIWIYPVLNIRNVIY